MRTSEIVDVALKAGEILLKSGAEIYRVEDTITLICRSYGVECECFVLLSGIFITVKGSEGEIISLVRRVKAHTFDLRRIEMANLFSRTLQKNPLTYAEAVKALDDIEKAPCYGLVARVASAGITAFVYTLLFGGMLNEAAVALLIGMGIYILKEEVLGRGTVEFFKFFISSALIGAASIAAAKLFHGLNVYRIILGGIMILLPGMALTNGFKDALYGDMVSSLYRLGEATFAAAAIGAGVGVTLSVGLRWL